MPHRPRTASVAALALGWATSVHSFSSEQSIMREINTYQTEMCSSRSSTALMSTELLATSSRNKEAHEPAQVWDANLYQDKHNFVWEFGSSLVDLAKVQPGERVLDIGCGIGELTKQLYDSSDGQAIVIGMDADPNMIQRAREQFGGDDDDDVKFFVGDACNFELDEPVDVLFSNAALHWVGREGASRAVESMSRALKENGRFVFEFGGKGNIETIVRSILAVLELPRASADFWYYPSIAEFSTLMEQHSLEVTRAELYDRPTPLVGEDGMKHWLSMFANKFFDGRGNEKDALIDRIVETLREDLYGGERWVADYRRIRVIGRKRSLESSLAETSDED